MANVEQGTKYADFVLNTRYENIPVEVLDRVKDLILDLIGVSAAAHNIKAVQLGRNTSVQLFNTSAEKDKSRILFDGRTASKAGAAFAGATQIGNLDAHDGFSSPKGHAGCGLFPGVLAFAKEQPRFMRANIRIQSIVRE